METKRVVRRKHSAELRAEVVKACRQPGASVAAIALRNGLNANVVHRWPSQDGRTLDLGGGNRLAVNPRSGAEFVPLQLPQSATVGIATDIRMELRVHTIPRTIVSSSGHQVRCQGGARRFARSGGVTCNFNICNYNNQDAD